HCFTMRQFSALRWGRPNYFTADVGRPPLRASLGKPVQIAVKRTMRARKTTMQKIMPCLWFQNNDGADAVAFYSAIFGNSRVVSEIYWGKQGDDKEGSLLAATFELDGMRFQILNG